MPIAKLLREQTIGETRWVALDGRGEAAALWMSPDELMILTPYGQADAACAEIAKAMAGAHHLALNVSDARAMFAIEGAGARAVLAKGAPADLSAAAFGPGDLRRTRVGLLAAAFWMTGPERFELICFRSYAAHMWGWLQAAAAAPGPDAVL